MKRINSHEAQAKVKLLNSVIGYRREIEKIEKDLKAWLKETMGDHNMCKAREVSLRRKP